MKKLSVNFLGFAVGLINIMIGAGGGIVAVEALKKSEINQSKAHATAIAITLPLTVISAVIYIFEDKVQLEDASVYLLPGLVGSALGSFCLHKIPGKALSKIFSVFMIYAGVRILFK